MLVSQVEIVLKRIGIWFSYRNSNTSSVNSITSFKNRGFSCLIVCRFWPSCTRLPTEVYEILVMRFERIPTEPSTVQHSKINNCDVSDNILSYSMLSLLNCRLPTIWILISLRWNWSWTSLVHYWICIHGMVLRLSASAVPGQFNKVQVGSVK